MTMPSSNSNATHKLDIDGMSSALCNSAAVPNPLSSQCSALRLVYSGPTSDLRSASVMVLLRGQFGGRALRTCRGSRRWSAAVVLHKFAPYECVPPLLRGYLSLFVQMFMVPQFVHAFLRDVGCQQGGEQILEALGLPR
eukprot:6484713-Amphidinium_carterae.1